MNKTYLIYRPVLDYEESMNPLLTCSTNERAEDVRQELIKWCHKTEKELPQRPKDEWGNSMDDTDDEFQNKRYKAVFDLDSAKFPFGLAELKEVFSQFHEGFDHNPESFLSIMELNLV